MKYDLTKCNNLNFRLNDGTTGFIKVSPSNDVYLYSNDKCEWDALRAMPGYKMVACVTNRNSAAAYLAELGLEIIPRDPETYTDWKVGDKVKRNINDQVFTILAVLGEAIILSKDSELSITALATADAITKYNKLVLTDYELELLNAKGRNVCPFKEGDKVLVRDSDTSWEFDVFVDYEADTSYPYGCNGSEYEQCIPLNERTWKLLGTTDEYKEE